MLSRALSSGWMKEGAQEEQPQTSVLALPPCPPNLDFTGAPPRPPSTNLLPRVSPTLVLHHGHQTFGEKTSYLLISNQQIYGLQARLGLALPGRYQSLAQFCAGSTKCLALRVGTK